MAMHIGNESRSGPYAVAAAIAAIAAIVGSLWWETRDEPGSPFYSPEPAAAATQPATGTLPAAGVRPAKAAR